MEKEVTHLDGMLIIIHMHNLSKHFDYPQPTKLKRFVTNKGGRRFRKEEIRHTFGNFVLL